MIEENKDVAIIVGRFQVPQLTSGHRALIKGAVNSSSSVIIFIGETKDGKRTTHDPLPFEVRKNMIIDELSKYYGKEKNIKIYKINDIGNYPKWVESLDRKIDALKELDVIPKDSHIIIWGSRDSVATRYKENGGKFDIYNYPEVEYSDTGQCAPLSLSCLISDDQVNEKEKISGTRIREKIRDNYDPSSIKWNEDIRKLAIWLSWQFNNDNE